MPSVLQPESRMRDVLRLDPSRTSGLRRGFARELSYRIEQIRREVVKVVDEEDAFGLRDKSGIGFLLNTRWKWRTNAQKIEVFRQWLEDQVEKKLLSQGQLERLWTERYIKAAYERGRVRGTSQAAKARRAMYTEFIQDSNKARRKVESLVQRNLEDLKGLSSRMATKASRAVADALERGDSPTKLANKLSRVLNIEKKQGLVIARTEMVRAQAEGQLDAMEDRGIRRVTAYVEFRIKDGTACPTCQALNGIVMTVKQARGIIPVHPNCRCAWGTVDDEEDYDTKRNRKRVRQAIRQSRKRG